MAADITRPPPALPTPALKSLGQGMIWLQPLSRRNLGHLLIILYPICEDPLTFSEAVPSPMFKWAEEGYNVIQLDSTALTGRPVEDVLRDAQKRVTECDESGCTGDFGVGLIVYDSGLWNDVAAGLDLVGNIVGCVVYTDESALGSLARPLHVPVLHHVAPQGTASATSTKQRGITQYRYPNVESYAFAMPGHRHFRYIPESLSHTRNLQFLRPLMGGPYYDLEAIWEEHTHYEFADRSVEHTMSTMVQEPYVNHVPTMTGGVGRENLTNFYRHNFIFNNSEDTELELISRTVGVNTVVDEFIFKFTHDRQIDWLLPGVPPTNLKAEVPFTAVVNIRGDRLYHEHISWDQGTVLRQLGLMPEYLPFPHQSSGSGKGSFEYKVPVAGKETADKMRDRNSVQSNTMFDFGGRHKTVAAPARSSRGV